MSDEQTDVELSEAGRDAQVQALADAMIEAEGQADLEHELEQVDRDVAEQATAVYHAHFEVAEDERESNARAAVDRENEAARELEAELALEPAD